MKNSYTGITSSGSSNIERNCGKAVSVQVISALHFSNVVFGNWK